LGQNRSSHKSREESDPARARDGTGVPSAGVRFVDQSPAATHSRGHWGTDQCHSKCHTKDSGKGPRGQVRLHRSIVREVERLVNCPEMPSPPHSTPQTMGQMDLTAFTQLATQRPSLQPAPESRSSGRGVEGNLLRAPMAALGPISTPFDDRVARPATAVCGCPSGRPPPHR
jgi:hypothetical protein